MIKVVISGAGPSGLLLAHHLMQKEGHEIVILEKQIYEKGEKSVDASLVPGERSYPMVLQARSRNAISQIPGLWGTVEAGGLWTSGMSLVDPINSQKVRFIPRQSNVSIERNDLVRILYRELMTLVETTEMESKKKKKNASTLSFRQGSVIESIDFEKSTLMTSNRESFSFDILVGADGANSAVRQHWKIRDASSFEYTQTAVSDVYKSLFLIHPSDKKDNKIPPDSIFGWSLYKNKKWNVDNHRFIGCAVKSTHTSGVYVFPSSQVDPRPFENCKTGQDVLNYFWDVAPALAEMVTPQEANEFVSRPISQTWTVKCNKLCRINDKNKNMIVLIGDAAHAVSASAGQGCNSALEDVQFLNTLLQSYKNKDNNNNNNDDDGLLSLENWRDALLEFDRVRLPDAHAVKELSDHGTPRTRWMMLEWILRMMLRKILPTWISSWLLRPLPMELLGQSNPILSYSTVLEKTKWWIDRIKKSKGMK